MGEPLKLRRYVYIKSNNNNEKTNKQINKQTKNIELNTEIPKLAVSSFSIPSFSISLLVHEQK